MGIAYNPNADQETMGIIPRAVPDIFAGIEQREASSFIVKVSFIEPYNENLFDWLGSKGREESIFELREDPKGGVKVAGLPDNAVSSLYDNMRCLEMGANNRATRSTAMLCHPALMQYCL